MTREDVESLRVTMFRDVRDVNHPVKDITLGQLFDLFTNPTTEIKSKIDNIRKIYKDNNKDHQNENYKQAKVDFGLGCTINGTCTRRNDKSMTTINPTFSIDIDNLESDRDIERIKFQLKELPYVVYAGRSMSGYGIVAIVVVDKMKDRAKLFAGLEKRLAELGIKIDRLGDDSRYRFLSYDEKPVRLEAGDEVIPFDFEWVENDEVDDSFTVSDDSNLKVSKDDIIWDDRFCYAAILTAIRLGYQTGMKGNNMNDWLGQIATLATINGGDILVRELSKNSPGFCSDKDVMNTYNRFAKNPNWNCREYVVRYFSFLKEKLGSSWISQIRKTYQK